MKNFTFILFLLFSSAACKKKDISYPLSPATPTLLSPITLDIDSTLIYLEDLVLDASRIDIINSEYPIHWNKEEKTCTVFNASNSPILSTLQLFVGDQEYNVVLRKSLKQQIQLQYISKNAEDIVQLKGEMTAWTPVSGKERQANIHNFEFELAPGNYQYIYIVNGIEKLAPGIKKTSNNAGGFNSLLQVKGSDKKPSLRSLHFTENSITLEAKNINNSVVLWENTVLPNSFIRKEKDRITIQIPRRALQEKRSFIRIWGSNSNAFSNDIIIPLQKGKVLTSSNDIERTDKHSNILYSLMIDRFYNGTKKNDHPLNRKDVLPQVDYLGGDFIGITKKIKEGYFSNLGINTLWLSPITQNPKGAYGQWTQPMTKFSGYHGYWPISSSKIDYRFGTSAELKELLQTAHENNINVLLDYVANHVHEEHPFYKQHPNWVTPLYLADGTKNTQQWDSQRLTTWFDDFMPTLDLENDTVMHMMTDSALFWIENYDFDGFRHDATKHIPIKFWRTLTQKIRKSNNPTVYQIGETYGSRELIASYVSSGLLDAQFDFNLYDNAVACFARPMETSFAQLHTALQESFSYFGYHHLMGNISGNHDRSRFISYASGDVKFNEDAKLAGWTRKIELSDSTAYAKLVQINAFNLTIPGVPVIYQGDEYGVPGGNDPDNRRMMQFDNLNALEMQTRKQIAAIAKLRSKHLALIYGDTDFLRIDRDSFAYLRRYFDTAAVIIFNKSDKEQSFKLTLPPNIQLENKTLFNSKFKNTKNTIDISLKGNSCEIIY